MSDDSPNYGYLGPAKDDDDEEDDEDEYIDASFTGVATGDDDEDEDDENATMTQSTPGATTFGGKATGQLKIKGSGQLVVDDDEDDEDDEDGDWRELLTEENASHVCQSCKVERDIDSTRTHAPNFCPVCETVRTFIRMDYRERLADDD